MKSVLPQMLPAENGGSTFVISSTAGITTVPRQGHCSAARCIAGNCWWLTSDTPIESQQVEDLELRSGALPHWKPLPSQLPRSSG